MRRRYRMVMVWMVVLALLASCGEAQPTPTRMRPTATPLPPLGLEGGVIAFVSERDGNMEIYVISGEGGEQRRLTNNAARDFAPAWSPDGSRIAFASGRDGNDEIYVMGADGSGARRLTNDPADDGFSSWSPDGTKLAFDSSRGGAVPGADGSWEIYVMEADGSGARRLTTNDADDGLPAWSPDGARIAFESKRDGNYEIYVMDSNGANQRRLTDNAAADGFPAWSPDGTLIAFTSLRDGNAEVYVMNADGSNLRRLTDNTDEDGYAAWSPDGAQIAFVHGRGGAVPGQGGSLEIYVMNADGRSVRRLTNNSANDFSPVWMP